MVTTTKVCETYNGVEVTKHTSGNKTYITLNNGSTKEIYEVTFRGCRSSQLSRSFSFIDMPTDLRETVGVVENMACNSFDMPQGGTQQISDKGRKFKSQERSEDPSSSSQEGSFFYNIFATVLSAIIESNKYATPGDVFMTF